MADADALKKSLGRSARVYAPYVLLRTMKVWSQLPVAADVSRLHSSENQSELTSAATGWKRLNRIHQPARRHPSAYSKPPTPNRTPTSRQPGRNCATNWRREKATLAANADAATRVLGNPMLADKEEVLTRRKGAPTTPVVLLRSITPGLNGLTTLVALDGSRADISEHEWRRASARFLHHWIVRAPRWMVPADAPATPLAGAARPVRCRRRLVRDDGRCLFGDEVSAMTYDPRLGIFAERDSSTHPANLEG